jgi:tetratricopeptide (TPR) repeat protein
MASTRRLAAILAADVAGYSRLMGADFARRFEDARKMLVLSLQEKPNWVPTYRFLASCYAQMGRLEEAREAVSRVRELSNVIVPSATHWRNLEHRELYLSGLRLAAGEVT